MTTIINTIVGGINFGIDAIVFVITAVFMILPDSPFLDMNNNLDWGDFSKHMAYFFDIPTMTLHFSLYVTAIGVYYVVRSILRWLKAIQ